MQRIRIQTQPDEDEHIAVSTSDPNNDEENAIVLVKHLERLQGQWQNVLQSSVYERCFVTIIALLCVQIDGISYGEHNSPGNETCLGGNSSGFLCNN